MDKKVIKINEAKIREIISEAVKTALNEIGDTEKGQYALGALMRRYRHDSEKHKKNPENSSIDGPIFQHAYNQIKEIPLNWSDFWKGCAGDEEAKERYETAKKRGDSLAKAFDKGLYGISPKDSGYFKNTKKQKA